LIKSLQSKALAFWKKNKDFETKKNKKRGCFTVAKQPLLI